MRARTHVLNIYSEGAQCNETLKPKEIWQIFIGTFYNRDEIEIV